MAICPYERKDPVVYAAQRHQLGVRIRDGMPVRAAARVLNIPYSTASLWVAQDGLRRADRAADAAGAARPGLGDWAKPGRGRIRAAPEPAPGEGGLPPADYPELKGLSPRKRLEALERLADTSEMRAVAAIEEGCITFGLSALREARRLRLASRVLQDELERYPDSGAEDTEAYDLWADLDEGGLASLDGREPVSPPEEPDEADPVSVEIWEAIMAAEAEDLAQIGVAPDAMSDMEFVLRSIQLNEELIRLRQARARWLSLPGRAPPPIRVQLPARRRTWLAPDVPDVTEAP